MAGLLDRVGDFVRGERSVGALVDKRVDVSGEPRRQLIEGQKRSTAFRSAYNRFKTYSGRGGRDMDPLYGPRQMATDISLMRDEALKVAMLNPHAQKAIEVLTSWTILSGANMIVKARTKGLQKRVTKLADQYFYKSNDCDSTGHAEYLALEKLVASYYFRAGEVLVKARAREFADGLTVPVSFDVIDPVRLFDGSQPKGVLEGNTYAAGIEFTGITPVAYWLYKGNPRDTLFDRTPVRVPVKDESGQVQIVHLFDMIYPEQIRGIPRAVIVLNTIYEQQDLRYSILRRKRMEAKIGLVLKENAEAKTNPEIPGLSGMSANSEGADDISVTDVMEFFEEGMLKDNMVLPLPPGWGFDQVIMQNTSDVKEFMMDLLRTVAAGYGVPYSALTTDLTQVSFSGGKLGLLDFEVQRKADQNYFATQFHRFCFSNFVTAGNRALAFSDRPANDNEITADFHYDAFPSAEAKKDQEVVNMKLEKGTLSRRRACAQDGTDFFEIVDEIAEEDEYLRSKGLDYLTHDKIMAKSAAKAEDAAAAVASTAENQAKAA